MEPGSRSAGRRRCDIGTSRPCSAVGIGGTKDPRILKTCGMPQTWKDSCFLGYSDIHIYIYCYPPWNLPVSIVYRVLQRYLLVLPSKAASIFSFIWRLGCLSVMSHDASCVDTMTYADGICSVFDYRIVLPTKGFNSNIDRMRTALWPNVNFKLYIGFYNVFAPSCDTWILDFGHLQILLTYYLMITMDQRGRYFFGLFFLTM